MWNWDPLNKHILSLTDLERPFSYFFFSRIFYLFLNSLFLWFPTDFCCNEHKSTINELFLPFSLPSCSRRRKRKGEEKKWKEMRKKVVREKKKLYNETRNHNHIRQNTEFQFKGTFLDIQRHQKVFSMRMSMGYRSIPIYVP